MKKKTYLAETVYIYFSSVFFLFKIYCDDFRRNFVDFSWKKIVFALDYHFDNEIKIRNGFFPS